MLIDFLKLWVLFREYMFRLEILKDHFGVGHGRRAGWSKIVVKKSTRRILVSPGKKKKMSAQITTK